jgi:site-specific recombinase
VSSYKGLTYGYSVKKDAAFVKGTRRFLDQIVASANITGDATQSQIARLKKQNDEVLRRCDDLERRYSEACSLVEASHQQDRDFGARWHEDAEVLVDTLKAGARAVQREIAAMTETSAASGIDARPTSLADEEAKTIKALGLNTTAVAMGLRQTMADGHAGLKKITRNLPLDGDAVMTG